MFPAVHENKTYTYGPYRSYTVVLQSVSPDELQTGTASLEATHNKTEEEI